MEHITLPAFHDDGSFATREVLEVERLDEHRVRLLHSPAYVNGLAADDVIETDPVPPEGYRLVRRGRNLAIVFVFASESDKAGRLGAAVRHLIIEIGGRCDGGPRRVFVFTIAVDVGFARVEAALARATAAAPGATWWYGNVYARDGKTQLGWWKMTTS